MNLPQNCKKPSREPWLLALQTSFPSGNSKDLGCCQRLQAKNLGPSWPSSWGSPLLYPLNLTTTGAHCEPHHGSRAAFPLSHFHTDCYLTDRTSGAQRRGDTAQGLRASNPACSVRVTLLLQQDPLRGTRPSLGLLGRMEDGIGGAGRTQNIELYRLLVSACSIEGLTQVCSGISRLCPCQPQRVGACGTTAPAPAATGPQDTLSP